MKRSENIILWTIIIAIALFALQFALQKPEIIVCTLVDDAYYYLKIAQNIASGYGATFDGIHKTNGFHPLWLLSLTSLAAIPHIGTMGLVRTLIVVQALLLFGSLYLIKRTLTNLLHPLLIGVVLLIPLYPRFFHVFTEGMESGLLIFLVLLTFYLMSRILDNLQTGRWFASSLLLGVLLTAIILTRLDCFFLAIVILAYLLIQSIMHRERFFRLFLGAFTAGVVILLGVLPFILWNYYRFGTIATISSLIKVKWNLTGLGTHIKDLLVSCPEYYLGILTISIFIALSFVKKRFPKEFCNRFLHPLTIFTISAGISLSFFLLLVKWALFAYAFAFTIALIVLGSALILGWIAKRIKTENVLHKFAIILLVISIIIAIALQMISINRIYRSAALRIYDAAIWAKQNSSSETVFAMKDCGCFGYYSERTTINLDGLVNDFEYQEYLKRGALQEYLKYNQVEYFVQYAFWDKDLPINSGDYQQYSLYIPSRIYEDCGGTVTVTKEQEVFRSEYYAPRGNKPTRVIIWRWEYPK